MLIKEKPNGKLRICIDPSQTINKVIRRPKYTIPTIEDGLPLLTKAKVFTIVDISEVFHTIELDEESSPLSTFCGPDGRYCYNRMLFGIASGLEEYQWRQHEFLDCASDHNLVIAKTLLKLNKTGRRAECSRN